jgi:hypothetical protein
MGQNRLRRTEVHGVQGGDFATQGLHDERCHGVSDMADRGISDLVQCSLLDMYGRVDYQMVLSHTHRRPGEVSVWHPTE